MRVTVFSTHPFEVEYLTAASNNKHQLCFKPESLRFETAGLAAGSEAIALFTQDDASAPVLEILHAIGIRYIATRSAGYDHIDLWKAKELGIPVARVPAYSPHAIAEHAVALIMALNRHLIEAHRRIEQNNFCLDNLIGFDMNGKTAGIIGLGKIGRVTAKILHGFGCRVLAYDVVPPSPQEFPVEHVSLKTLLAESDIISLHAPLTPQTKYLINAETIYQMKKGVMLINTSRGGLVNTSDLIEALQSGKISAAGLDVYENEKNLFFRDLSHQPLQDNVFAALKAMPNILITGHQAFLTSTALKNIAETTLYNLDCWQKGLACENEVN